MALVLWFTGSGFDVAAEAVTFTVAAVVPAGISYASDSSDTRVAAKAPAATGRDDLPDLRFSVSGAGLGAKVLEAEALGTAPAAVPALKSLAANVV